MSRFLLDENVPISVRETLRKKGFQVTLVTEAMGAGAKNHDIAELANRSQDIIVTFDDDFLRLKPNTKSPLKVIYIRLHPRDPRKAQEILDKWINECLKILDHTNLVTLSESGPTERHE